MLRTWICTKPHPQGPATVTMFISKTSFLLSVFFFVACFFFLFQGCAFKNYIFFEVGVQTDKTAVSVMEVGI